MELVKDNWKKNDIIEFQKYLESFKNEAKTKWAKNLLRTNLPVLAMKTKDIKEIVNGISKGNYLSFLDHMVWDYYENTVINGFLISKIKEFDLMKKYLDIYSGKADNWATCDLLSFYVNGNEEKFIALGYEYIKSDKPFVRRIGIEALFKLINDKTYLKDVFRILNSFKNEDDYYVNMINAWLLCDLFIKQRDETLKFINNNDNINKFTINKMISKCRDSFRVSKEDKDMLLNYKR